jgi:peptidoglycan-associated lipoprotein
MRNQNWRNGVCVLCVIAALAFAGCKKRVAAAAPIAAPPVQQAPPAPAPTITLRATPNTIDRGQTTSLQWEAKNATSISIQPEVGNVQAQGSQSIHPNSSVTYTAVAMGPGGNASDSTRITVRVPAAAAPPAASPLPRRDTAVNTADLFSQNVQTIYFDFDKSNIRTDQLGRMEANASWLKEHRGVKFTIEGGCDDRGSAEYNLGLGDRRANQVKESLIKEGVDPSVIKTISYGKERPVCREASEDCYSKNRRAGFVMVPVS